MEKHRCRLCFRNFANGKALGGHMRSHMMNFYAAKKGSNQEKGDSPCENLDDFLSYSSTSSQSSWEREEEEKGMSSYELRENPKKSTLFVDPEFSSVVLQDGESETESLKNNSVCRRSKRVRNSRILDFNMCGMKGFFQVKKSKFGREVKSGTNTSNSTANYCNEYSSMVETEPLSSISDTTPDEDVAYCLIMLSRDKWKREEKESQEKEEVGEEEKEFEDDYYYEDSGAMKVKKTKVRGKYRCDTCNKLFRSYQALGGHRASHKKIKVNPAYNPSTSEMGRNENAGGGSALAAAAMVVEEKIYECPFCHRVFSSGQALGGHKRSHFMGNGAISKNVRSISTVKPISRIGETLSIDLNLPAPVDNHDDGDDNDDEISQIALSAISDAEFVYQIKP